MAKYIRMLLEAEVLFGKDGSLTPKRIFCNGSPYDIDRIIEVCPHCPIEVGCVAPIRYRAVICGREKEIYYEADSNTWFSVREIL